MCIWVYVVIMSRASLTVNIYSLVFLNVKERLARSRHHIRSLTDSNGIRTHNHLVRKRTLNYLAKLAKWLSCVVSMSDMVPLNLQIWCLLWAKSSLTFRQTIACRFTLKPVHNMIITYSQMRRTDKFSQHSSIIKPVWVSGWVFVYEVSGCAFESRCCHLNFRYGVCFEQGGPWHSGKL